jgi:hypothetical protein
MDGIEEGKIGKKDEKLVGWDHIRKPKMNTKYPPMRARKSARQNGILDTYRTLPTEKIGRVLHGSVTQKVLLLLRE